MKTRIFWIVFLVSIALDQAVKFWVRGSFAVHESPGYPWSGVLEITLQYNEGIAFGMFQGIAKVVTPIAIAIAAGSYIYSRRHPEEGFWTHLAMGLLAGGALGNLYDRLVFGRVTDMFAVRFVHFPVFNVADSCITVAAAILILKWSRELVLHHPDRKPGPSAESEIPPQIAETAQTEVP